MSAFGLAQNLGIERATAQAYIDSYFSRYPGVARYMQETRELARERGYVETVFGRRLWLPEIRSGGPQRRQAAERAAINAPMQGTAADLIKLAMVRVHDWLVNGGYATKLVMQVHDELVLEVPPPRPPAPGPPCAASPLGSAPPPRGLRLLLLGASLPSSSSSRSRWRFSN